MGSPEDSIAELHDFEAKVDVVETVRKLGAHPTCSGVHVAANRHRGARNPAALAGDAQYSEFARLVW